MGFIWFSTTAGNKRPVENKLVVELGLNKIEREHSCWSYRDRIRTREIVNLRTGTYGKGKLKERKLDSPFLGAGTTAH